MNNAPKTPVAIIIGAGPGGLTAAYELLTRTGIIPIILERSKEIGGISRTVNYKGNRIDIGGHRFFSKSKRVMDWWQMFLPLQTEPTHLSDSLPSAKIMLVRNRRSRIFFLRNFFEYPIRLSLDTLRKLGVYRIIKIGITYFTIRISPIKKETSLEDFFINRFGKELYNTFFKDYTEKVWGVACNKIKPDWGAQRIKGLSVSKAIRHAVISSFRKKSSLAQKNTETSLIDRFMYPRLGPGQLWEEVAEVVVGKGGTLVSEQEVTEIRWLDDNHVEVTAKDALSGMTTRYSGNYLFSTMPIVDLIASMKNVISNELRRIADGLAYRDFMTVGLLLKKLKIKDHKSQSVSSLISDNWIYIQENDVLLGRLQVFNNWSPDLVDDKNNVWVGLEYFCTEGEALWSMKDHDFVNFAIEELVKIEIICREDVLDSTVIRVPKAYPAYFGTYNEIDKLTAFTDSFKNMFLIGRNGMHKYNNQDHSMLTAMVAVDNIINGEMQKENIWNINTEDEYHEANEKE